MVGETTFKFFFQFNAWTAVYCVFTLVLTAKIISEQRKDVSDFLLFQHSRFSARLLFGNGSIKKTEI